MLRGHGVQLKLKARRHGAVRVVGEEESTQLVLYELSPAERSAVQRRTAKPKHSGRSRSWKKAAVPAATTAPPLPL